MSATLLLVDDDALTLESEAFGLACAGHWILTAANLVEAAGCVERARPDLVLIDIDLPDGSGLQLGRWLHVVGIPFVFVSGRAAEADIRLGLDIGAVDYLVKPVGLDELVARVGAVICRVMPPS